MSLQATPNAAAVDEKNDFHSDVAKRPADSCKVGRPVNILTNSFHLEVTRKNIHIYSLEFDPPIPEDAVEQRRREVNIVSIRKQINADHGGIWFFENTQIWSFTKKRGENVYINPDGGRQVILQHRRDVAMANLFTEGQTQSEQREQAVHIMLKIMIRKADLTRIGSNYFEQNERLFGGRSPLDIRGVRDRGIPNIRVWSGFAISAQLTQGGLQLMVDPVHRVIHQQSIAEFIDDIMYAEMGGRGGGDENRAKKIISDELIGASLITLYNKRVYRITDIEWNLGPLDTFEKDGQQISYRDYYKSRYNEDMKWNRNCMLIHEPKRKKNNALQRMVLPPEFCYMTGMTRKMKEHYPTMRKIGDMTRISASERHQKSQQLAARLQQANVKMPGRGGPRGIRSDKADGEMPLHVDSRAITVEGHVLPAFGVKLGEKTVDPYRELKSQAANAPFVSSNKMQPLDDWCIIYEKNPLKLHLANDFTGHVERYCRQLGLWNRVVASPRFCEVPPYRGKMSQPQAFGRHLETVIQKYKPQLVVTILPDSRSGNPTGVYNMIKTISLTHHGVHSQCIKTESLSNQNSVRAIMKNVVKQMLTKIGNVPWRVEFSLPTGKLNIKKIPTMFCGVDVNHDMRRNVSTVGMCASYLRNFDKYHTFVGYQPAGREALHVGGEMMLLACVKFRKKCGGFLPQQIVVFRDGVSSSQVETVVDQEVRAYKDAFKKLTNKNGTPYNPKLSVVIVQKRVSARFLDENYNSLDQGTVIDTGVVSAKFWDFYIVPCAAPFKGTASPTRFIVAYDDLDMAQDDIAALCNQLCLIYFNWAGPVRVPAPIQYAHKIAHLFGTAIDQREPKAQLNGTLYFL